MTHEICIMRRMLDRRIESCDSIIGYVYYLKMFFRLKRLVWVDVYFICVMCPFISRTPSDMETFWTEMFCP